MLVSSEFLTERNNAYISKQKGFTLVELMVVVAIIAILATIAIPSYRSQVRQNAEHQAKQRALNISNELASWRSKRLSYNGFVPRNEGCGLSDFCYSVPSDGIIYVPLGSTASSHKFAITIVDAQPTALANGTPSTAVPLTNSAAGGKGWRMLIVPNSEDSLLTSADRYYLDSLGQKCRYKIGATLPNLSDDDITCTGMVW